MQFDNSLPIYQQVVTAIKKEIAAGRIAPGDKLPSCRDLAVQYRINPNTAARVYQVLETEHVTETRRGTGTYVREEPGGRHAQRNGRWIYQGVYKGHG